MTLSATDAVPGRHAVVTLSRDRRTANGGKGFKLVRATRGVSGGTWFCEWTIGGSATGQVRVGWASEGADAHAPVGYDEHSYSMRSVNGARVHQSVRSSYGRTFGAGDVVGCLITFATPSEALAAAEARDAGASAGPADAARILRAQRLIAAAAPRDAVEDALFGREPLQRPPWAGGPERLALPPPPPDPTSPLHTFGAPRLGGSAPIATTVASLLAWTPGTPPPRNAKKIVCQRFWGSSVRFFVNGVDQGAAFVHLTRCDKYYPAIALSGGASARFTPGPPFAFPPAQPQPRGEAIAMRPTPSPLSVVVDGQPQLPREFTVTPPTALVAVTTGPSPDANAGASDAAMPQSLAGAAAPPQAPPLPASWPRWRPIADLEPLEGGGGESNPLHSLLGDVERPSLDGLQSLLAGRAFSGVGGSAVAFANGVATAKENTFGVTMTLTQQQPVHGAPTAARSAAAKASDLLRRAEAAAAAAHKGTSAEDSAVAGPVARPNTSAPPASSSSGPSTATGTTTGKSRRR